MVLIITQHLCSRFPHSKNKRAGNSNFFLLFFTLFFLYSLTITLSGLCICCLFGAYVIYMRVNCFYIVYNILSMCFCFFLGRSVKLSNFWMYFRIIIQKYNKFLNNTIFQYVSPCTVWKSIQKIYRRTVQNTHYANLYKNVTINFNQKNRTMQILSKSKFKFVC